MCEHSNGEDVTHVTQEETLDSSYVDVVSRDDGDRGFPPGVSAVGINGGEFMLSVGTSATRSWIWPCAPWLCAWQSRTVRV